MASDRIEAIVDIVATRVVKLREVAAYGFLGCIALGMGLFML
jgi:hypothetical protein